MKRVSFRWHVEVLGSDGRYRLLAGFVGDGSARGYVANCVSSRMRIVDSVSGQVVAVRENGVWLEPVVIL